MRLSLAVFPVGDQAPGTQKRGLGSRSRFPSDSVEEAQDAAVGEAPVASLLPGPGRRARGDGASPTPVRTLVSPHPVDLGAPRQEHCDSCFSIAWKASHCGSKLNENVHNLPPTRHAGGLSPQRPPPCPALFWGWGCWVSPHTMAQGVGWTPCRQGSVWAALSAALTPLSCLMGLC